jgi:hypothetical protein
LNLERPPHDKTKTSQKGSFWQFLLGVPAKMEKKSKEEIFFAPAKSHQVKKNCQKWEKTPAKRLVFVWQKHTKKTTVTI